MVELKYTDKEKIPSIVRELRQQFMTGLTKDLTFRREQLENLQRLLLENKEELMDAVWKDLHKHKLEADTGEIAPIVDEILYMLKPSEVSAHTAEVVARLVPKYLDQRAYVLVNGAVEETTLLLEQKFDHIFYTGNGTVGKIVMAAASRHLTPVTLELGGKSPAIVAADANIQVAANRLMFGKFYNNGQTCVAPDYVLVAESKADELIEAFQKTLIKYYSENPQQSESYGRIVNHRQFDRLQNIIDSSDPSSIVVGGKSDREDLYIAPTIIKSVKHNDPNLMEQEIFGPILPVVAVKDIDEAVNIINSRDSPLAMYIFTEDKAVYNTSKLKHIFDEHECLISCQVLDRTNSGGVLVNDTLMQILEMSLPFGGVGPSGMGSYHGDKSFYTFTHERATMVKTSGMEGAMNVRYPPYNADKHTLMGVMVYGLPAAAGAKVKEFMTVCAASWNLFFARKNEQSKL
ncbi:aldehyde dehydrogenase 3, member A2 [Apophysomyces ossiformis]|uniref:Aldehyde dehydrogenase n=1 Tax=Apophysomyces ossiformis TaxID=679940 RepID=A0A8H7BKW4_9FUNG|nr:aldehyde dehydrogenase 3, member A2 [Apophysomyces ossiformis]